MVQPNIYDGAFLRKKPISFSCYLLTQKGFIVDVSQGAKYVSEHHPIQQVISNNSITNSKEKTKGQKVLLQPFTTTVKVFKKSIIHFSIVQM